MRKKIAVLCCLALAPAPLAAAGDAKTPTTSVTRAFALGGSNGPLRAASLSRRTFDTNLTEHRSARQQDASRDKGSWMARHPVWTGAMIGFGAGVLITYASASHDDDEFLTVISPGAAATFWGGVTAGVGALAGWGIGRNRD